MPVVITTLLTTECSKPCAKKVTIGSQAATILPIVEVEVIAITTPRQTSQLQSTALTKTLTMPAMPSAAFATVLASAIAMMRDATPLGAAVPMLVSAIASSPPNNKLPMRLPRNTHPQLAMTAPQPDFSSSGASGNNAKLPVTSSRPSSTIITKPTGKMI